MCLFLTVEARVWLILERQKTNSGKLSEFVDVFRFGSDGNNNCRTNELNFALVSSSTLYINSEFHVFYVYIKLTNFVPSSNGRVGHIK